MSAVVKKNDKAPQNDATMKDLCEAMSDFRSEVSEMRTALKGEIDNLRSTLSTGLDEAKEERIRIKDEATLIRGDLLELASHADFAELDNKIAIAANDAKAIRLDLRNMKGEILLLKSTMKNAGMSVQ